MPTFGEEKEQRQRKQLKGLLIKFSINICRTIMDTWRVDEDGQIFQSQSLLFGLYGQKIKGLVGGQRESDLKLSGQLPPCWLVFIALEGAMQAVGGEKTSVILPSAGPCLLQYQPAMQDMPTYNNGITVIRLVL